ncbi:MAG: hypothetical protein ACK56I_16260, partial [bacterium]
LLMRAYLTIFNKAIPAKTSTHINEQISIACCVLRHGQATDHAQEDLHSAYEHDGHQNGR